MKNRCFVGFLAQVPLSTCLGRVLVSCGCCRELPQTRGFKNRNVFSHCSGGWKSETQAHQDSASGRREDWFLASSSSWWLPSRSRGVAPSLQCPPPSPQSLPCCVSLLKGHWSLDLGPTQIIQVDLLISRPLTSVHLPKKFTFTGTGTWDVF